MKIQTIFVSLSLFLILFANFSRAEFDPNKYPTEIDYYMTLTDKFIEGFKADETVPSTPKCAKAFRESYHGINYTSLYW